MKTLIAAAVAVFACSAHAESFFQIEAGIGAASATKLGDGMYYDAGLSHRTPINSIAGRIGVVLNLKDAETQSWVPGARVHLNYTHWGAWSWSAAVGEDGGTVMYQGEPGGYNTLTRSCLNDYCGDFRQFNSTGSLQSINLTVEPYWDLGGTWAVGIEAGPALYIAPWNSEYIALGNGRFGPAGSVEHVASPLTPHLGAVIGASVSHGPFSVRYEYLFAPAPKGSTIPSGVKGAHMLTANYTW